MWNKVEDELPDDDRLVLVWGRYVADNSNGHEVAKFRRKLGWNVSPYVEVSVWRYFDAYSEPKEEEEEVEEEEDPQTYDQPWYKRIIP